MPRGYSIKPIATHHSVLSLLLVVVIVVAGWSYPTSGEGLKEALRFREDEASQAIERARVERDYLSSLLVMADSVESDPATSGTGFLRAILDAISNSRLDSRLIPLLHHLFLKEDPAYRSRLDDTGLMVIVTSTNELAGLSSQYRHAVETEARTLGFKIVEKPGGAEWIIGQEILLTDQGSVLNTPLKSRRAGGHVTVRSRGGSEKVAIHQSEAAAHLDPGRASAQAMKKLADSTLRVIVKLALEKHAARSH